MPIIFEFLNNKISAEKIVEKYHICSLQTFYAWIGKYLAEQECLLQNKNENDMADKSKDDRIRELKEELKKARKEAELEKLRAKAYDTMINPAEETFNTPVRKKSGTKQ